jgi:carbon-monoxide dehydrogenase medium subunit
MTTPKAYHRPTTLNEALSLLTNADAIAVAGGALLFGRQTLPYEEVIDLQGVAELRQITPDANGVTLGAAVPLQTLVDSEAIPTLLKTALTRALPLNLRNGATVGESLLLVQPPREWLAALVAYDAAVTRALPSGEHLTDSLISLMDGSSDHASRNGIITGVFLPTLHQREAVGAAFVARTPADEAIVNAAAFVQLDASGRVDSAFAAICGASAEPVISIYLDTLAGNPLDEANIASAVKAIAPRVNPVGDYLGSADYRREMARVTVQRALLDARAAVSA